MHFTYLLRVDSKNQYFTGLSPAQASGIKTFTRDAFPTAPLTQSGPS